MPQLLDTAGSQMECPQCAHVEKQTAYNMP